MKDYPITELKARDMPEEHSSYVYGIALMITKSPTLADDITQDTFLRAFAKYDLYDSSKPLRPWNRPCYTRHFYYSSVSCGR